MSPNRRTLAIGLIVFGVVLVVFAIVYPIDANHLDDATIPLPEEVAGLPLQTSATGLQAIQEITNLHGVDFELADGVRGSYGFGGEVTLWVSASVSEDAASQLLTAMRDKITEGNSPFEPIGEEVVGGRMVYKLEGHGQVHDYFQSGDLVIWLAADDSLAGQALEEALAFYP